MRVPPELGEASSGSRSAVARYGGGDPLGRRHPDRAAEEAELAHDHRHSAPEYAPLAGQHGFVSAGGRSGVGQLPGVGLAHRHREPLAVPADEGALVQHRIPQLVRRDTTHSTRLYRLAPCCVLKVGLD
jgi:hypothetical protein